MSLLHIVVKILLIEINWSLNTMELMTTMAATRRNGFHKKWIGELKQNETKENFGILDNKRNQLFTLREQHSQVK